MDLNETKAEFSKGSKRALLALIFAFLLAGAGVVAYLTAHDSVINLFSFAGEDKDVTVEWREVPPTIDVNHDGKFLVVRVAWNNTTATYVEGSATTTLDAYSVGNEGSFDAPDPYIFLADTQTEEQYQTLLIGAEVNVTNSVVPVPTGNLFYIEKDRGSTEHPTKGGVSYSKYRMTVKPYTTTVIKESQLKRLLSVQPVEPQWSGYVHNGWTTPVKVGLDPDTGNDKYVVKSTWVKRSNPDVTEDSSYAAVYGDDTLVFGRGAAPGSYEGKPLSSQNGVACTWYDIEDAVYSRVELPWRDMKPNIKSVVVKDTIAPKSIAFWFETMGNLASVDLSKLDASKVEDAQSLFGNDALVSTIDLSMLDMPKVKNISNMFYGCKGATLLKIPGGLTNELKEMGQVFYDCISVKTLDLEGLDISGVTNMGRLFWNCPSLTTVFVNEDWSVDHIRDGIAEGIYDDHGQMFSGCTNLVGGNGTKCENRLGEATEKTSITYANIDSHSQVGYLTCRTTKAGSVTISSDADTPNILSASLEPAYEGVSLTYQWCKNGQAIAGATASTFQPTEADKGSLITCKVVVNGSFELVSNEYKVDGFAFAVYSADDGSLNLYKRFDMPSAGSTYNGKTVTNIYIGFENTSAPDWRSIRENIKTVTVVDKGITPQKGIDDWFSRFSSCTEMNLANLDVSKVTSLFRVFGFEYSLVTLDVSGWDTSNVTNMSEMFYFSYSEDGEKFTTIKGIESWDTSNVTNMSGMFEPCQGLTCLNLSSWDTSKVTNMARMFSFCSSLTSLDVSTWDTSSVTSMRDMFYYCPKLTSLDVSGWDASKVTNMGYMFANCSALTSLDVSTWDTSQVNNMSCMFSSCNALTSLDVSSWDTSKVINMNSMFYNCASLKTIYSSPSADWSKVSSSENMFFYYEGTPSKRLTIVGGKGTKYDTTKTDASYARVDGLNGKPGYFTAKTPKAMIAGTITVSGTTQAGNVLTANVSGTQQPSGLAYKWYRDDTLISGAASKTYLLTAKDIGHTISCKVTNKNYRGYLKSLAVGPVSNPAMTGSVSISGTAESGSLLTASVANAPIGAVVSYQWLRDGSPIDGATGSTYTLVEADIDHTITCVVTASGFSGSLVSNGVGPVTKPKTEVEKQLESMTLHEKVCQMFTVYPEDLGGSGALTVAGSTQQKTLQNYPYGGVCYFLQNIKNETQAKTLVSTLESYSEIPLFHAVDEEGGRVQRIGGTTYSGAVRGAGIGNQLNAMYTYKDQGADTAYNNAQLLAANLNRLGMNWDFAPCADVNSNPSNPVIGDRAYGDDFDATGELVASAVRGFNDAGVATALKHFPGHGDTATDSHTGAAAVSKTLDQLRTEEFKSFKAGIAAGADSVMMGHLMIEGAKESVPTSCSYEFVTEVLRNELGFDGVITTDGMGMGALTKVFGTTKQGHIDAVMACLKAGIDVFLLPGDPAACVDAIETAVASGEISEDRIDASVKRILTLKEKIAANKSKRNAATLQAMHAAAVADEELTATATQSTTTGTKVGIEIDAQSAAVGDTLSLRAITEGVDTADNVSYRWYVSSKEDMTGKALIENATQAQIEYLLNDPGTWYFQCEVTCGDQTLFSDPIACEAIPPESRQ